jgi:uncharacterized protein YgbK (DUF1537 family)
VLAHKTIVLDDDPTGTQTVQGVAVLTSWDLAALAAELRRPAPLFFILTNTRAMPEPQARAVNRQICQHLRQLQRGQPFTFTLISRGDSTLRGHFPAEPEAITEGLGERFDAWFLIPFFAEGGRLTRADVHYVREGERLVPVAETPFAQDATFGFRHSNLKAWVEEKTHGQISQAEVASVALAELRAAEPGPLVAKLAGLQNEQVVVVNAETYDDLAGLAQALEQLPHKRFLFRTAASWVKVVHGRATGQPEVGPVVAPPTNGAGGLLVVGSYVPKTTEQLAVLRNQFPDLLAVEVSVTELLAADGPGYLARCGSQVDQALAQGRDVVVFTSRDLAKHPDPEQSLAIGNQVSAGLVALVQQLATRPRYLVAKGGITSSDLATKALGVQRALVRGQVLPGVPAWQLEGGRFPGLFYVVFPGNVGGPGALAEVYDWLRIAP